MKEKTSFQLYLMAYGHPIKETVKSRYYKVSIMFTFIFIPLWFDKKWWELVLSIMPNILGVTMGAFALFLTFGNESFRKIITGKTRNKNKNENEKEDEASPFIMACGSFTHFILAQLLSMLVALFFKGYDFPLDDNNVIFSIVSKNVYSYACVIGHFFGFQLFSYALMLIVATCFALLHVGHWVDSHEE